MMLKYEPQLLIVLVNPPLNCLSVSLDFNSFSFWNLLSSISSLPTSISRSHLLAISVCPSVCLRHTCTYTHTPINILLHTQTGTRTRPNPSSILSSYHSPMSPQTLEFVMLFSTSLHLVTVWFLPNHYFADCLLIISVITRVLSDTSYCLSYLFYLR